MKSMGNTSSRRRLMTTQPEEFKVLSSAHDEIRTSRIAQLAKYAISLIEEEITGQ
jgi:hypothetical protein